VLFRQDTQQWGVGIFAAVAAYTGKVYHAKVFLFYDIILGI